MTACRIKPECCGFPGETFEPIYARMMNGKRNSPNSPYSPYMAQNLQSVNHYTEDTTGMRDKSRDHGYKKERLYEIEAARTARQMPAYVADVIEDQWPSRDVMSSSVPSDQRLSCRLQCSPGGITIPLVSHHRLAALSTSKTLSNNASWWTSGPET